MFYKYSVVLNSGNSILLQNSSGASLEGKAYTATDNEMSVAVFWSVCLLFFTMAKFVFPHNLIMHPTDIEKKKVFYSSIANIIALPDSAAQYNEKLANDARKLVNLLKT